MKKILLFTSIVIGVAVVWFAFAPRIRIDYAARSNDPSHLDLDHIEAMHKSHALLTSGVEAGFLFLASGERVKYWFISKHVQPGSGLTRFDFPDGQTEYLSGAYCCEVSIGEEALKDKNTLIDYIESVDGSHP